jgi:hypothetical protein
VISLRENPLRGLRFHEFNEAVTFGLVGFVKLANDFIHLSELAEVFVEHVFLRRAVIAAHEYLLRLLVWSFVYVHREEVSQFVIGLTPLLIFQIITSQHKDIYLRNHLKFKIHVDQLA